MGASGSSVVGLIHPASLLESFWLSGRWSPRPHRVQTTTLLSGHLDWLGKRSGILKKNQNALIHRKTKENGNNGMEQSACCVLMSTALISRTQKKVCEPAQFESSLH